MPTKKSDILTTFSQQLSSVNSLADLEQLEINYLGRKGMVNKLFTDMKSVEVSQKGAYGKMINEVKQEVTTQLQNKKKLLKEDTLNNVWTDVSLPGEKPTKGSLHLVTYAIEEISAIFERIGFARSSYPEVEWEYFSFESLNMPPGHPARDDFETFFVDAPEHAKYGRMVLTPHTSNGQVREMLRVKTPPIAMINISKTYRPNWDVSHTPMFHQFEGLCIDEGITIANLKGTIEYFATNFFGPNRKIRLRPYHFQFTEPSFEVDISCDICDGTGYVNDPSVISRSKATRNLGKNPQKCKLCKQGWLELGGAGMVHPNVLKEGNIDTNKYSGFAFGFGIERVYMMKGGLKLDDLRTIYSGDIRFLEQF